MSRNIPKFNTNSQEIEPDRFKEQLKNSQLDLNIQTSQLERDQVTEDTRRPNGDLKGMLPLEMVTDQYEKKSKTPNKREKSKDKMLVHNQNQNDPDVQTDGSFVSISSFGDKLGGPDRSEAIENEHSIISEEDSALEE